MTDPLHYDHLPYIAAAYGLFALATLVLSFGARARLARATRRLRAADPRARLKEAAQ
jgi:hypothetical protein